jgi:hypothetical protein
MDIVLGISIVIATFAGPILAVCVTRYLDDRRQVRERQLRVFRSLMATRRTTLAPEKVRALNLVEIEFHGRENVISAFGALMTHLNDRQAVQQSDFTDRHQKLLTKLLSEMAKVLGYELPQLDVLEGGYYPQGHADIELEQQALRRAVIAVMTGNRPLLVSPAAATPAAPYPPPPPPPALPGEDK